MILVVNLNLAVDQILRVDGLQLGGVHRSKSTLRQAGGKGVNVARVLRTLGEPCVVTGFLGGELGEFIARGLYEEAIAFECTPIENESRTCLVLVDSEYGHQTVINEPGPELSEAELARFEENYGRLLTRAELVIITGSLPPGLPTGTYANLINLARGAGRQVLFDSSSEPLRQGVHARPFLVKINQIEAGELVGESVSDVTGAAEAADRVRRFGPTLAVVTLGQAGAVVVSETERYKLIPPKLNPLNTVGSGDAVMAGLASGIRRGYPMEQMGTLAMAAGAANALHGGGRCTAEEISLLKRRVLCVPLP
jgi:tagatose 6-phosphate kinase